MATHSPEFRKVLRSINGGEILTPAIRSYLADPQFSGFDIKVRGMGKRDPDDWFHPSTHPSWSERALYLYVTTPEVLHTAPMNPMAVMSMTAGTIWHNIVAKILLDLGLLDEAEVSVRDEVTRAKGHMDGVRGDEIFELKTMKDVSLAKISGAEDYISKHPTYFLQAQEYMRMSGLRSERVLLMALTYPYEMREFVIEYDEVAANRVADKYLRVRQAVADQRMPPCSGCLPSAECPARAVCQHLNGA